MTRPINIYRLGCLQEAVTEACREDESMSLAGIGPEELVEDGKEAPLIGLEALEAELQEALTQVRALRAHTHAWDERGFCEVCGADGNA
jgi:hypothetical protein